MTRATTPGERQRPRWVLPVVFGVSSVVVFGLLAAIVLPLIWPVTPLADTVPPTELGGSDDQWARVGDLDVHYRVWGSEDASRTIVLIHGFGSWAFSWRDVGPLLGQDVQVVAVDRTGFGLTSRPLPPGGFAWRDESPYSATSQARTVWELLSRLGVERAVLVGHSQGAEVAVVMAGQSPARVEGLVLVAPAVAQRGVATGALRGLGATPQGRRIGPVLVRGVAGDASDQLIRSSFADPASATPEVLEGYRLPLRAQDWDVGLYEFTIAPQPVRAVDLLGTLEGVPTLVIVPTADAIVEPDDQRSTAAAIPGAQLFEAETQGHLFHEERPAEFSIELLRFLATIGDTEASD